MGDIFISYASSDRSKARLLADILGTQGWSVWWDREISPGKSFAKVIESALDSAKCIIVLWSQTSVSSDWVQSEAAEGARRQILVPSLLEEVKIPLEFRRIQAADLSDWHGETSHPELDKLLKSIRTCLGTATSVDESSPSEKAAGARSQKAAPRSVIRMALVCLFGAAVAVSVYGLLVFASYILSMGTNGGEYVKYLGFFFVTALVAGATMIRGLRAANAAVISIAVGAVLNLVSFPRSTSPPLLELDVLTIVAAVAALVVRVTSVPGKRQ